MQSELDIQSWGWVQRGPTWKLLIKAQTAHGIPVTIKVTLANNNDFQTIL